MKGMRREAALLFREPRGFPDCENVDTRGTESSISDTNNGGSADACRRSLEAGSRAKEVEMGRMKMGERRSETRTRTRLEVAQEAH